MGGEVSRLGANVISSRLSSGLLFTFPPLHCHIHHSFLSVCLSAFPTGEQRLVQPHFALLSPQSCTPTVLTSFLFLKPTELFPAQGLCTCYALSWFFLLSLQVLESPSLDCPCPAALYHNTYRFPLQHLHNLGSSCLLIMYLVIVCLLWRGTFELRGGGDICPAHLSMSRAPHRARCRMGAYCYC